MSAKPSAPTLDRAGARHRLRASVLKRTAPPPPGIPALLDPEGRGVVTARVLLDVAPEGAPAWSLVVPGYGAACAEEVELWERADAVLVGVGSSVVMLDVRTGAVKARVRAGGYFNCLHLAEDGRDAYVCGDEQVFRLMPDGSVGWKKALGTDGVMVHRAVGLTVFCSAQKRLGGPWVDYLLDRGTGAVTEAPEPEDETDAAPAAAQKPAAGTATTPVGPAAKPAGKTAVTPVKSSPGKAVPPGKADAAAEDDDAEELDDESAVKMVRDDENDPDDE